MPTLSDKFIIALLVFPFSSFTTALDFGDARDRIRTEVLRSGLDVSVSALHVESGKSISVNGDLRLPMASVYKFPIALVLLKQVEEGKISLSKPIAISKDDIRGGANGPIATKYPNGGVSLPLSNILEFMVSNSDNSACDLILKLLGGPSAVTVVLHSWGFDKISVDRFEEALLAQASDPGPNHLDTASANELTRLLDRFSTGRILNQEHTRQLTSLMTNPDTPKHIQRELPAGASVVRKGGWCAKTKCINDIAIITLPKNRGHLALAILAAGDISNSEATSEMMGRIAKIAFDASMNIGLTSVKRE